MITIYRVDQKLPQDLEWVCAHTKNKNWIDNITCTPGAQQWKVVRFQRGISKSERMALPKSDRRRGEYHSQDEGGNNERPYYWMEFGPGDHFGQDVDMWFSLPKEIITHEFVR